MHLNTLEMQFRRNIQPMSKEDIQDTIYDLEHCKHLFVKLKEGGMFYKHHSQEKEYHPPIYECVHCGITNKFMDIEEEKNKKLLAERHGIQKIMVPKRIETYESMEFKKQFIHAGEICGYCMSLISSEPLDTNHPGLLYFLSQKVLKEKDAIDITDKEQIFKIMKELNDLETEYERDYLRFPIDAEDLMKRYYDSKKVKILKK